MSKEMGNQSFNDRHSLTGNSGMHGLSSLKTNVQPIRIKALMDMYGSDEEDSDSKDKDSDSESDCEDIQPLPEDDVPCELKNPVQPNDDVDHCSSSVVDGKPIARVFSNSQLPCATIENDAVCASKTKLETSPVPQSDNVEIKAEPSVHSSLSTHFTNDFSNSEQARRKSRSRGESSVSSESIDTLAPRVDSLALRSSIHSNRRSNVELDPPILSRILNEKPAGTKIELMKYSSGMHPLSSKEEPLHSTGADQPEPVSGSSSTTLQEFGPTSHLIIETPMKNNPPAGSMRPTPSVSHRNIFQTPQNSKFQEGYSKNHVQTPATIFGHWSQNHMAQTPLQNYPMTGELGRAAAPSILPHSTRDIPSYRGTEEKRPQRRPLAVTMLSKNYSSNDQSSSQYHVESSSSVKTCNKENHTVLEPFGDKCPDKLAISMQLETKENKLPIEKSTTPDEPQKRNISESVKDTRELRRKTTSNEDRSKVAMGDSQASGKPEILRANRSTLPPSSMTTAPEKKNDPPGANSIQASVSTRIRRSHQGETLTVKGREYLILGILGEGMSGQVFRVQDRSNLELRAIKVVNLSRLEKESADGCLQEISMLHKLQAPCVVRIFDFEIKYPEVLVVLEMGDTDFKRLLNSMSEKKRLPLTMILYYWTEMLTAVKHIHDNGVIHSDLKPANFLLVRGRLKLIDFGIASSMNGDMTSVVKNSPIGTLNYISPEALMDIGGNGGDSPNHNLKYKISFKSDVWSLGCILYSLVYGYTPFHNLRTQWAKVHAITNPKPKISFSMPAGNDSEPTPPILIDVMRKCLQHDPKARPTVAQLLQIPYIPIKQNVPKSTPDIPSNILMKIKYALTDAEWREFTEIMEARTQS